MLLCTAERAKAIIDRIKDARDAKELRDALNDVVRNVDMKEAEDAEDALRRELEDQGLDLDQLLKDYPEIQWRRSNPNDLTLRPGFMIKD